eukprot:9316353-Pyramimonas_sp.AAC.1
MSAATVVTFLADSLKAASSAATSNFLAAMVSLRVAMPLASSSSWRSFSPYSFSNFSRPFRARYKSCCVRRWRAWGDSSARFSARSVSNCFSIGPRRSLLR